MTESYVDIMLQSLKKKVQILDEIIRLDEKQKEILENVEATPDEFDEVVEEKGRQIEQLELLDSGFEKLFEKVKDQLEGNKEQYAESIKQMQSLIRKITDKSVEIQAQEARNKELMTQKFAQVRKYAKAIRTGGKAASQYYKNTMKLNEVDPQFLEIKS